MRGRRSSFSLVVVLASIGLATDVVGTQATAGKALNASQMAQCFDACPPAKSGQRVIAALLQ